jgi:hypothetical protein
MAASCRATLEIRWHSTGQSEVIVGTVRADSKATTRRAPVCMAMLILGMLASCAGLDSTAAPGPPRPAASNATEDTTRLYAPGALCNGGGLSKGAYRVAGALGFFSGPVMSGPANKIGSGFWIPRALATDVPAAGPSGRPLLVDFRLTSANPFRSRAGVEFTLSQPARVNLALFDVGGRMVRPLEDGPVKAGRHGAVLSGKDLASGVYLCRISMPGESRTLRLVHVR